MKTNIPLWICIISLTFGGTVHAFAQETVRERLERRQQQTADNNATGLSIRAEQMTRNRDTGPDNARWMRVVYRYLDLSKEANAPLYDPVTPTEGRMNLFTMIFKQLQDNNITAYEYLDGREVFTEEYAVDFREFMDRFGIYYREENGHIVIDDIDIPGNEVQGYFVKEAYYFETGTSNFGVKPIAICPVIHRQDDYGAQTVRYPLFWIPYDAIRPYALRMPVMTSSLNNTMSGTIDDFFQKNTYDGEIYKTMNLRNLAISQYAASPEEMKKEQEKIEHELIDFEKNLWKETAGSTEQVTQQPAKRSRRSTNTSSAPTQTMRNRRY